MHFKHQPETSTSVITAQTTISSAKSSLLSDPAATSATVPDLISEEATSNSVQSRLHSAASQTPLSYISQTAISSAFNQLLLVKFAHISSNCVYAKHFYKVDNSEAHNELSSEDSNIAENMLTPDASSGILTSKTTTDKKYRLIGLKHHC